MRTEDRGTIHPNYIDTAYPRISSRPDDLDLFHRTRFEFALVVHKVLDISLRLRGTAYADVQDLHTQL